MENLESIRTYLESRLPFYLDMLRRMVAINSFTANPDGVNELAEMTAGEFAALGFSAEMIPSENAHYGNHLVLTRQGSGPHRVGFVSHLDTVFPPEEERENDFFWREEGDRIYGPGTVDIKGGTVMMYMMLEAIRRFAPAAFEETNWVLLLDASEEADGEDFGRLCKERLSGDETVACLIFEAGYLDEERAHVVVARKGMAKYLVEVEGRASHAGSAHEDGANAIVQMADLVSKIANLTDYERDLTFNVGTISGGSVVNRVPHYAAARVEMRAYSMDVFEQGVANMLALTDGPTVGSVNGDYSCRASITVTRRTEPWPHNEQTNRLFSYWQKAGERLGLRIVPEQRGGLSDGNYFWRDIPSLDALGPSGGNAHCSQRSEDGSKDQEYLSRSSLVSKAMLNTMALLALLEDAQGGDGS